MSNRFWMAAALAIAFAVCGVASAQDKKGSGIEIKPPANASAKTIFGEKLKGQLSEMPRAIGVGGGGAAGITNLATLEKALKEIGAEFAQQQPEGMKIVLVSQIPIFVGITEDSSAILMITPITVKPANSLPASNLLGLMGMSTPTRGVWHYETGMLQCCEALETKSATKGDLAQRLSSISDNVIKSFDFWKDLQAQ